MNWPANDKPADFEDMAKPIERVFRQAFEPKKKKVKLTYSGLGIGHSNACAIDFNAAIDETNLQLSAEQGRDTLSVLIEKTIQVGIEQGRRLEKKDGDLKKLIIRGMLTGKVDDETITILEGIIS